MNGKTPYTPLSTHLSGSARETELRLRNIFSGPKKRPPVLFLVLMFSACIFCGNLVSCQNAEAESPDIPDSSVDTPDDLPVPPDGGIDDPELYALLNEHYRNFYPDGDWYWDVDTPDQPKQWDIQLGAVEYLGSGYAGTRLGSAYTVERRSYREESGGWTEPFIDAFAIERREDGTFGSVVPAIRYTEGLTGEDVVLLAFPDLFCPELTLYQKDNPYPLGVWSTHFADYAADYVLNTEPQVEIHEDREPYYSENDYWATLSWDGLSTVCYYDGTVYLPSIIDVTRTDLCTPRGVQVGDSRTAVREAYPELEDITGPNGTIILWGMGDLEGADALKYQVTGFENSSEVLLFFFEGDALSRMVLRYTMD